MKHTLPVALTSYCSTASDSLPTGGLAAILRMAASLHSPPVLEKLALHCITDIAELPIII